MTLLIILGGIIGLGIMVFVHELGHFVAAKMNGVGVEVLALGWGPKLAGFTYKGTSYQISWFPIGGYCKMKGELVPGIAGGGPDAAATGARPPEPGSFLAAAPWRRIVISAFGPLFNLVFAFLVFALIWGIGFSVYSPDNRIIVATDYTLDTFAQAPPAVIAGLKTGDRITQIDGAHVEKFQDILQAVSISPGKALSMKLERMVDGAPQALQLSITPQLDKDTGAARIGIYAWTDPVVKSVVKGSAAALAGLHPGDRLVQIDGRLIRNTMDIYQALASRPGKVSLGIVRGEVQDTASLVFVYDDKGNPNLGLGFVANLYRSPRLGFAGALSRSGEETWSTVTLTVKGIGLLFKGLKLRNAVAGPLRIGYYLGEAATSGFALGFGAGVVSFFRLLAFLSVVLFLMNLLPIPAMDGGQIVLFIVEIVRGRAVRSRLIWRLQLIGFSLLILLFLSVTFSDILFFAGR
jgi:regulator of sigma E protease